MKHSYLWGTAVALGVAACAPLTTYYKPGVSVNTLARQTLVCEARAVREVPPSTQVRRTPPRYIPPRRTCDGSGNCKVYPGHYVPGDLITFDPNDGLRERIEAQCMADRGYAPVSIPPCPGAVARTAPTRATTTLPNLNAKSCVIRNRDGSFQIVTRG